MTHLNLAVPHPWRAYTFTAACCMHKEPCKACMQKQDTRLWLHAQGAVGAGAGSPRGRIRARSGCRACPREARWRRLPA